MNKAFTRLQEVLSNEGVTHLEFLTDCKYLKDEIDLHELSNTIMEIHNQIETIQASGVDTTTVPEYRSLQRQRQEQDWVKGVVMQEVKDNFWFFLREIVQIPDTLSMIHNPLVLDDRSNYEYSEGTTDGLYYKYPIHKWDFMFYWQILNGLNPLVVVPEGVNIHLVYAILMLYYSIHDKCTYIPISFVTLKSETEINVSDSPDEQLDLLTIVSYFHMLIEGIIDVYPFLKAELTSVINNTSIQRYQKSYTQFQGYDFSFATPTRRGICLYTPAWAELTYPNPEDMSRDTASSIQSMIAQRQLGGFIYSNVYHKLDPNKGFRIHTNFVSFTEDVSDIIRSIPELSSRHSIYTTSVEDLLDTEVQTRHYKMIADRLISIEKLQKFGCK